MLNSRASVDAYAASESWPGLTAVPTSTPELRAASRSDSSEVAVPNPRQKTEFAKTTKIDPHFMFVTPVWLSSMPHFASGRNFCKGHSSHCGCDFRQ